MANAVESVNIVGYSGINTDNDYGTKILGAQFASCANSGSTEKIKLADITPIATGVLEAGDLAYGVSIQILNNWGGTVEGSTRLWDGEKWATELGDDMSAEEYDAGTGFCVANSSEHEVGEDEYETDYVNFKSAGSVIKADVLSLADDDYGTKMMANSYPTNIKLSSIIPSTTDKNFDGSDVDLAYGVSFQKLNNWGGTIEGSTRVWDGEKWTTELGDDMSNEELLPGEGICVANSAEKTLDEEGEETECATVTVRFVAPTAGL